MNVIIPRDGLEAPVDWKQIDAERAARRAQREDQRRACGMAPIVGASTDEQKEGKMILEGAMATYLNGLVLVRWNAARIKDLNKMPAGPIRENLIKTHKKAQTAALDASKAVLVVLQAASKAENTITLGTLFSLPAERKRREAAPDIWTRLQEMGKRLETEGKIDGTLQTTKGAEFKVSSTKITGPIPNVGEPISSTLILVTIIILAVAGSITAAVLTSANRKYYETAKVKMNDAVDWSNKAKVLYDDYMAGKMTQDQYKSKLADLERAKAAAATPDLPPPPPTNPLGFDFKGPLIALALAGGGYLAWKAGLFNGLGDQLKQNVKTKLHSKIGETVLGSVLAG